MVRKLRQHYFHGGLTIEMSALENESVNDTLARVRRGREFLASSLGAKPHNLIAASSP